MNGEKRLAVAIIKQAVLDLEERGTHYETDRDVFRYKRDAYNFFETNWYQDLAEVALGDRYAVPDSYESTAASQFKVALAGT